MTTTPSKGQESSPSISVPGAVAPASVKRRTLADLLAAEASRYLAAVDVFTDEGCDPFESARAHAMADRIYDGHAALARAILQDHKEGGPK